MATSAYHIFKFTGRLCKYIFVTCIIMLAAFAAAGRSASQPKLLLAREDTSENKPGRRVGSFITSARREMLYHPDSLHKPHTAVIRSLILPGLGQFYNRRWWKLPVIYGGLGLFGSGIIYNQKNYLKLIAVYRLKHYFYPAALTSVQNPNHALYVKYKTEYWYYQGFSDQEVADLAESWRRNRDICILGVAAIWTLNAIDAYIDAKFINTFTVDNNLTVKPVSDVLGGQLYGVNHKDSFNPGIKITFAIR